MNSLDFVKDIAGQDFISLWSSKILQNLLLIISKPPHLMEPPRLLHFLFFHISIYYNLPFYLTPGTNI